MKTVPDKTYLGDGAYCSFDGYSLVVTTENGIEIQNEVHMEPQVFEALLRYAERCFNVEIKIRKPAPHVGEEL